MKRRIVHHCTVHVIRQKIKKLVEGRNADYTSREQQMMCDRRKFSVAAFIGLERRVASSGGEYIKAA
jgi:hypothetical protein